MKLFKKIFTLVLVAILCVSGNAAVASAAGEENDVRLVAYGEEAEMMSARSVGNCVASSNAVIQSNSGTIVLTLDRSYSNGVYFRAGATGNSGSALTCIVTCPDGSTCDLGLFSGNSGNSPYYYYSGNVPAGNYTFTFSNTSTSPTVIAAFIFEYY